MFFFSFWQVHLVIYHLAQKLSWHVTILGFYRRPVVDVNSNHNINNIIHISRVASSESLRLNSAICLQTP